MDTYRGSPKHKNRPGTGRKGTLCPEWTHTAGHQGFNGDPFNHEWEATSAHQLFAQATTTANDRRYATARGIAFEAKPTADGSWHGYPVAWEAIPPAVLEQWLIDGKVTRRDLRQNRHHAPTDIHWALGADEP
jgi:hypothetical protein